jgi:hypothetical protein
MNLFTAGAFLALLLPGVAIIAAGTYGLFHARVKVSDRPHWITLGAGALLFTLPLWLTSSLIESVNATGQLAAGIVVILGFSAIASASPKDHRGIGWGILLGTSTLAIFSVAQIAGLEMPFAQQNVATLGRSTGWLSHPNLWALTPLVPALLLFMLVGQRQLAWINLVPAITLVITSGSRTGALALLLPVLLLLLFQLARLRHVLVPIISVILALCLLLWAFFANTWLHRFNPFVSINPERNLLFSSEDLSFGAWSNIQVSTRRELLPVLLGSSKRQWIVAKTGEAWWARVGQTVRLEPGKLYSWRMELQQLRPGSVPGVHGISSGGPYAFLRAFYEEGQWHWESGGALKKGAMTITALRGGWQRVELSFRYTGSSSASFQIGATPDQRTDDSRARLRVRAMQYVSGELPASYSPTWPVAVGSRNSTGTLRDRFYYMATAISGWKDRPWLGWGKTSFSGYLDASPRPFNYSVSHAHNLFAQVLFERGVVGLVGLALLLIGMIGISVRQRPALGLMFLAVLISNTFDYTFWSAPVFYPLMAVTGWYAGATRHKAAGQRRKDLCNP